MRFRGTPSIAYRLAMIAAGDADATVSLNNPNSWDFGAGQALLIGAGAKLIDGRGQVMAYTRDGFADSAGACFGGPDSLTFGLMDRDWKAVRLGVRVKSSPFVTPARGQAIEDPDLLSRAQGSMIGQFAGDALGAVVEGLSGTTIHDRYPGGLRRLVNGGVWGTIAGQPTDDSEMALMLARSIVRADGFDLERAGAAYAAWYRTDPFGIGETTRAAMEGRPDASSLSDGALTGESCRGGLPAGGGVGRRVFGRRFDASEPDLPGSERIVCRGRVLCDSKWRRSRGGFRVDGTAGGPARSGSGFSRDIARGASISGVAPGEPPVITSFRNAFWQLLHARSVESGVVDTVMRGGDTDTNAAIAGALLGAVYGLRSMPSQWTDRIVTCRPIADSRASQDPGHRSAGRSTSCISRNGCSFWDSSARSKQPIQHQTDLAPPEPSPAWQGGVPAVGR